MARFSNTHTHLYTLADRKSPKQCYCISNIMQTDLTGPLSLKFKWAVMDSWQFSPVHSHWKKDLCIFSRQNCHHSLLYFFDCYDCHLDLIRPQYVPGVSIWTPTCLVSFKCTRLPAVNIVIIETWKTCTTFCWYILNIPLYVTNVFRFSTLDSSSFSRSTSCVRT